MDKIYKDDVVELIELPKVLNIGLRIGDRFLVLDGSHSDTVNGVVKLLLVKPVGGKNSAYIRIKLCKLHKRPTINHIRALGDKVDDAKQILFETIRGWLGWQ